MINANITPYSTNMFKTGFGMMSTGAFAEFLATVLKTYINKLTADQSEQNAILGIAHFAAAPLIAGFLFYWLNVHWQKIPKDTPIAEGLYAEGVIENDSRDHAIHLAVLLMSIELSRVLKSMLINMGEGTDGNGHSARALPLHDTFYFAECPGVMMIAFGLAAGMMAMKALDDNASPKKKSAVFFTGLLLGITMGIQYHSAAAAHMIPFAVATPLILLLWKMLHTPETTAPDSESLPNDNQITSTDRGKGLGPP